MFVTCDADAETGVSETIQGLNAAFSEYFGNRSYDDSGINITIILMCRDPRWQFKQRIRFSKKENKLFMDLMLDWKLMVRSNQITRKKSVAEIMTAEAPRIIAKRKFKDFDLSRFTSDLREWFEVHGWIDPDFLDYVET
jgi:hypothetical protein